MAKDIMGNKINIGDIVVAPHGKDHSIVGEVVDITSKMCKLSPVVGYISVSKIVSRHHDSVVVVNSITNKLDSLGL